MKQTITANTPLFYELRESNESAYRGRNALAKRVTYETFFLTIQQYQKDYLALLALNNITKDNIDDADILEKVYCVYLKSLEQDFIVIDATFHVISETIKDFEDFVFHGWTR